MKWTHPSSETLMSGSSKKTPSQGYLSFPRITSHAAVLRAQRHVSTSIISLRHGLSYRMLARMGLCPRCGRVNEALLLRHSQIRDARQ